jgi:hypothetical protein
MYLNDWKDFHLPAFLGNTTEASNMWTANVHFRRALNLRTIELNEVRRRRQDHRPLQERRPSPGT